MDLLIGESETCCTIFFMEQRQIKDMFGYTWIVTSWGANERACNSVVTRASVKVLGSTLHENKYSRI